jgi:hypothetical protein
MAVANARAVTNKFPDERDRSRIDAPFFHADDRRAADVEARRR